MSEEPAPRLENRLAPDDAHGRPEHPLRELVWLLFATLSALAVIVFVVGYAARWLAPHVPFSAELALAERILQAEPAVNAEAAARRAALQALAERVAAKMALPAGMVIVSSDVDTPTVNAYATIGGRVRIHHGLLRRLAHEDELAALLAHEIAHVKHRHVAANLGRGLTLALLLSVLSSDAGAAVAQGVLNQATSLALLGYSREQEREADAEALRAVTALYGHAAGLMALMQRLADEEERRGAGGGPELLRTHPHSSARLAELRERAARAGVAVHGVQSPLGAALKLPPLQGEKPPNR